ncbi:Com family DNA-binding transcriptional regulator [Parablastomonas sp. CN1-191]|uniref:Com family DNA-binding transcriptional regulator n=1 Tax=Parablastomonas sp. CN1-191 TaxID=3400908 RepID=UPI003BF90E60
MAQFDMMPIPAPEEGTRSVLALTPEAAAAGGPMISGAGTATFRCGRCKRVILKDVGVEQVQEVVFQCPKCGTFNEPPPWTQSRR